MFFFLLGHVCGVWKFWPWCRGPAFSLCSVWPVLPSILCWHKGAFASVDFVHHKLSIPEYVAEISSLHMFHCYSDRSPRWS